MSLYNFSCLGHFPYCVTPLILRGSHPLPDQLPGEYTGPPSHMKQYLFLFGLSMQHSFTHSLMTDRSMVVGHVPMYHTCSFHAHQSHRDDSTHPSLFTSWGALWEPLACSYDISHSRTWKVSITSLAATSVSQMVIHPSTNQAQNCLTSVIRPWMVAPCL